MKQLLPIAIAGLLFSATGFSQATDTSRWQMKLRFHIENAYGRWPLTLAVADAGFRQETNSPREWGQGWSAYGERLGSTLAYSGVRNAIGFGLDTILREDPRYYRSGNGGFLSRTKHVIRGTLLTRTDSGGETLSIWRLGSAYGGAVIANEWQPQRVDTIGSSLRRGTTQIGLDVLQNFGSEFWPDIRKKLLHHRSLAVLGPDGPWSIDRPTPGHKDGDQPPADSSAP